MNCRDKKLLVDPANTEISVSRQCELLGLNRSSYYYQYRGISDRVETIMRLIDERYTECPCEGSRRIMKWLERQGYKELSENKLKDLSNYAL